MESLGTSPGALPFRGLVFQLVCHFHRYGAYSSKSTLHPKTESCFQDGACSVSSFKSIQNAPSKYKMKRKKKEIKESHIYLIGMSKDKNRENGEKTIFLKIMTEKFLELMKDIFLILDSQKGCK